MVRPYSNDLRERVIADMRGGQSAREVADTYQIAPSTAVRWFQRWRALGVVTPARQGHRQVSAVEPHLDWMLRRLAEQNDLTTRDLAHELIERGVTISHVQVWKLLRRAGWSHKKKRAGERAG